MNAVYSLAVIGLVVALAGAALVTLTGLDRWLDDRQNRRDRDRFDVFTDGRWRE